MPVILQVGFARAPVGPDAVGGAEQVLGMLDRALVARGHRSIVVAPAGSVVSGTLHIAQPGAFAAAVAEAVVQHQPHLVHMHGLDFLPHLPPPGVPVLVTLHLPPAWYPPVVFALRRPRTWLNPVSATQAAQCPPCAALLPPIGNGVEVEHLRAPVSRRGFTLSLGRICPEKNQHEALEAGRLAGIPVLLGGQVFPYADHERYWQEQVVPALTPPHRFLGPIGFARKRRLLSGARCLLSTSLAPETSSLVAMEALACGTPVVAYPSGALAEIVEHGETGYLVESPREMAAAIQLVRRIDPEACRAAARNRFNAARTVEDYLATYHRLTRCADAA